MGIERAGVPLDTSFCLYVSKASFAEILMEEAPSDRSVVSRYSYSLSFSPSRHGGYAGLSSRNIFSTPFGVPLRECLDQRESPKLTCLII